MRERLAALEAILPTLATKADIASIGQKIVETDVAIKNWMIATIVSLLFGIGALVFTASSFLMSNLQGIKSDVQRSLDLVQTQVRSTPPTQLTGSPQPPVVIQLTPEMLDALYKRPAPAAPASSRNPPKR
jgi:hypothetical protein